VHPRQYSVPPAFRSAARVLKHPQRQIRIQVPAKQNTATGQPESCTPGLEGGRSEKARVHRDLTRRPTLLPLAAPYAIHLRCGFCIADMLATQPTTSAYEVRHRYLSADSPVPGPRKARAAVTAQPGDRRQNGPHAGSAQTTVQLRVGHVGPTRRPHGRTGRVTPAASNPTAHTAVMMPRGDGQHIVTALRVMPGGPSWSSHLGPLGRPR
jgi:hypothetical protein